MKTLKDITKEQAIEIAKLIYDFDKGIKSDFTFIYQPYVEPCKDNWEGEAERVIVEWKGQTFGEAIDDLELTIYPNLNCFFEYIRFSDKLEIRVGDSLPTRNQYKIQQKFIEWNIQPQF